MTLTQQQVRAIQNAHTAFNIIFYFAAAALGAVLSVAGIVLASMIGG